MKYKDINIGDVLFLDDDYFMIFFVKEKGYRDSVYGERIDGLYYTFSFSPYFYSVSESFLYKKTEKNKKEMNYNNMCDNWKNTISPKNKEKVFDVIFRS